MRKTNPLLECLHVFVINASKRQDFQQTVDVGAAICNLTLVGPHMTLFLFPPTVGLSGRWCCGVKLLKTEHCGLSHDIYVMKAVGEGNGLMILSLLDYCAAMKNLGLQ